MSLRASVISTFKKHVFQPLTNDDSWKILVMDKRATIVLSSAFRMRDLADFRILNAESLYCSRQPYKLEAVYIMRPHKTEIDFLINDFRARKYIAAHVYFLHDCPPDLINELLKSPCGPYLKTLKQLDLDFLLVESSVFTFDCRETAHLYPLPIEPNNDKQDRLELLATQLANVCVTLQEYPRVCYRRTERNLDLARMVVNKLEACLESNPAMGQGLHKDRSILLLLDRGFDPLSPVLHELTLQAMCHDLLAIEKNMYTFGDNRKFDVADEDPLWREFRHLHIAVVSSVLPKRIRAFAESKKHFTKLQNSDSTSPRDGEPTLGLRQMSDLIKEMPQYQAEAARYTAVSSILEACFKSYRERVEALCKLEQDLVMGPASDDNQKIDPMRSLSEILRRDLGTMDDRLRLLLVFVLIKDAMSESHLDKLLSVANVAATSKVFFASLSLLCGAKLIQPDPLSLSPGGSGDQEFAIRLAQCNWFDKLPNLDKVSDRVQAFLPTKGKRKNRVNSKSYMLSRWTPHLVDIMEGAIAGTLNKTQYAFLAGKDNSSQSTAASVTASPQAFLGPSARFQPGGGQSSNKVPSALGGYLPNSSSASGATGTPEHCGPRLIVCIVGGVTWSEARVAYEITQKCIETRLSESDRRTASESNTDVLPGGGGIGWNWEVVIGGTHMLTPESFIGDLDSMYRHFASDFLTDSSLAANQSQPRKPSQSTFYRL